jgi:hypothetical protein
VRFLDDACIGAGPAFLKFQPHYNAVFRFLPDLHLFFGEDGFQGTDGKVSKNNTCASAFQGNRVSSNAILLSTAEAIKQAR